MAIEPNLPPSTTPDDATPMAFDAGVNAYENDQFTYHQYPSNLGGDEFPHALMFYITVRKTELTAEEVATDTVPALDQSKNNRPNLEHVEAAKDFLGPVVGMGAGAYLTGLAPIQRTLTSRAVGTGVNEILLGFGFGNAVRAVGAIGGGLAGKAAFKKFLDIDSRSQVTLKQAIALYLPQAPESNYFASWSEVNVGNIQGGTGTQIDKGLMDGMEAFGKAIPSMAKVAILKGADKMRGSVLGDPGALLQAGLGMTVNPFKAQLFNSMGMRRFRFSYRFLPRDVAEYEAVRSIIKTFKFYMHPSTSPDRFILNYPAEFTIAHFFKNSENPELFKMANCALTNLSVRYGGEDMITFRDYEGAPSEIDMIMEFVELEMLTRDRIKDGY